MHILYLGSRNHKLPVYSENKKLFFKTYASLTQNIVAFSSVSFPA